MATTTRQPGRVSVPAAPTKRNDKREHLVTCPVCREDAHLALTWKLGRDGDWRWFLNCYTASCQGLDNFPAAVAAAVGAPHGWALAEDPLRWLASANGGVGREARARRPDAPFVSEGDVWKWHRKLLGSPDALAYVHDERGLSDRTIRTHALGYDGRAVTIPVFDDPFIFNVKRRYWPEPWKLDANGKPIWKRGLAGARSRLYPDVPAGNAILLCEGELDALIARQHGLPAMTSTTSTSWSASWDRLVKGKRVAVVYDSGADSFKIAQQRAAALCAAEADAWPVDLRSAGLKSKEDLTDWFVTYGRTSGDLLALIRRSR